MEFFLVLNFPYLDSFYAVLIIAELNTYGISLPKLKLMDNYFVEQKRRSKTDQTYSSCEKILFGVCQGSILGSILLNVFPSDLFLVIQDIDFANYADDNPIDATGKSIDDLTLSFQKPSKRLLKSFASNQMNCNIDKCRLH